MPAKLKISPGSKYGKLTVTSEADGLGNFSKTNFGNFKGLNSVNH